LERELAFDRSPGGCTQATLFWAAVLQLAGDTGCSRRWPTRAIEAGLPTYEGGQAGCAVGSAPWLAAASVPPSYSSRSGQSR